MTLQNDADLRRCTIEDIAGTGVSIWHRSPRKQVLLSDCTIRRNLHDGLVVRQI